jgi:glutathione S-transferase
MKLHYTKPSPYARKVIATARELGIFSQLELIEVTTPTVPTNANPALAAENPLVKVPVLEMDGGERLYDSVVIAEYLDAVAGGRLFPKDEPLRWHALKLHALADGAMDAGVLVRLESLRPGMAGVSTDRAGLVFGQTAIDRMAPVGRRPSVLGGDPTGLGGGRLNAAVSPRRARGSRRSRRRGHARDASGS